MSKIVAILFFLSSACYFGHAENRKVVEPTPVNGIRIAWDYSSMQQLAEMGGYPRMLRMKDNSFIIIYETRRGNIHYKRSYDNGMRWSEPREVFSQFSYSNLNGESTVVNMSNPEIIQTENGDILIACNYRPAKAEIAPYSIVIRRSKDNGTTWLPAQTLYTAAPRFRDGCWEPSFLQLPDGEVQVYFANEKPYQQSDEQEISMVSSTDNGETWTKEHKTVSFRKNRRDGMPVARIVGDEIVTVIEDNYIDRFKPYTVRTKIRDNWASAVLGDSPRREYALTEQIDTAAYLGAPYLLVLPTGETVISYQTNENRDKDWELSTMEVAIGNKHARNFDRRTQPFDVPPDKEAKWNSLALWDENTIVAVASTNFKSEHIAPWIIKGYIIPELRITGKEIINYPIFVGGDDTSNIRTGIGTDDKNLYLECSIRTTSPSEINNICFLFDCGKERYKILYAYGGEAKIWKNKDGEWRAIKAEGIKTELFTEKDGYRVTLDIPKKIISLKSQKTIRLNTGLTRNKRPYNTEWVVNSREDHSQTWLKIEF